MLLLFRSFAALAVEWSSFPQTHSRPITTAYDSTSREPTALFWLLWVRVCVCMTHKHTRVIDKYKIKLFKKNLNPSRYLADYAETALFGPYLFSPSYSLFMCSNSPGV